MTWIKLKTRNDWGVNYYADPRTPDASNSAREGLQFIEGARVGVKWPDGSTTAETVKLKKFHTQVGDMGHTYDVDYELAGFEASTRGAVQWYRLDSVEVDDVDLPRHPGEG